MNDREPVAYQVAYFWECPDCGTTWQTRRRPRGGFQLVCARLPEQAAVSGMPAIVSKGGCGSMSVSAGRRKGLAPNL